jgi:Fur family transcriptional regulator, peroxide stress response regulator
MILMALDDLSRSEKRFQQMLGKLKSLDFRITPQRLAVLRILAASEEHPTAEQIFERVKVEFPTTSLATIYKTIALLKGLNEVLELGFPDGSNRYDGNKPFPHPHVICTRCRKIMDPELMSLDELKDEISKKTGFRIQHHRLDFFGVCQECQEDT